MIVRRRSVACAAGALLLQFVSMATAGATRAEVPAAPRLRPAVVAGHRVGLGKVLSTADGGQIFGWDIDEHGTDGVLTTSQDVNPPGAYKVSVETFDQTTATITRSFAKHSGTRHSYLGRWHLRG